MQGQPAMAVAIEAYRNPSRLLRKGSAPFPDDMLSVIKVVAGDEKTIETSAMRYGIDAVAIQEMARNYVIKQLLDPKATGLRLLGLNPGAEAQNLRDHKRWLLKWLHPDRNPSAWEQAYFNRISTLNEAELLAEVVPVEPLPKSRPRHRSHHRGHPVMHRPKTTPAALLFQGLKPLAVISCGVLAAAWLFAAQPNLLAQAKSVLGQVIGADVAPLAGGNP
jgi:hypothetical protein